MGLVYSRRSSRGDVVDSTNNNAYKYPPKTGSYFGNYFIMGGTRFESTQPDSYLFGENKDLNFLGNRPTPFPYPAPQANEPTRTLKSLVNIRKDSLKFVRETEEQQINDTVVEHDSTTTSPSTDSVSNSTRYNIEFTFDTDVKCAITIYYFATEEIINKNVVYKPRDPVMNSETFHYKRGANQVFCQPTHFITPSLFSDDEWAYNTEKEVIPIVIHCVVDEEGEHIGHAHMTFAIVEKSVDGAYVLKAFKQKQIVDGLCYLLQEIYGIENKNTERAMLDEDYDDNGSECVICMSETRDTLILPCRHLCLCNGCADNLRYQANNCPICRSKFRALLQLRAIRKKPLATGPLATISRGQPVVAEQPAEDGALSQEGVPAGYEAVSLIEALNGPTPPHCALNVHDGTLQSLSQHTNEGDAGGTNANSGTESNHVTPSTKRKQRKSSRDSNAQKSDVDIEEFHASPSSSNTNRNAPNNLQSHGRTGSIDSAKKSSRKIVAHQGRDNVGDVDEKLEAVHERKNQNESVTSRKLSKSPSASSVEYISEVNRTDRSRSSGRSTSGVNLERNEGDHVINAENMMVKSDHRDSVITHNMIQAATSDPLNAVSSLPDHSHHNNDDDDDDDDDEVKNRADFNSTSSSRELLSVSMIDHVHIV